LDLLPRGGLAVQLDLDLLGRGELGRRHTDLEHAVGVLGVDLARVHPVGDGEGPLEAPVRELPLEIVALHALMVGLAGSADGQGPVCHGDVDILGIDAGQGDTDAEGAVLAMALYRRPPGRRAIARVRS
jgi:hypothetical protein